MDFAVGIWSLGERVGAAVVPSLCTNEVAGSSPGTGGFMCIWFSVHTRSRRFFSGYSGLPPAFKTDLRNIFGQCTKLGFLGESLTR